MNEGRVMPKTDLFDALSYGPKKLISVGETTITNTWEESHRMSNKRLTLDLERPGLVKKRIIVICSFGKINEKLMRIQNDIQIAILFFSCNTQESEFALP